MYAQITLSPADKPPHIAARLHEALCASRVVHVTGCPRPDGDTSYWSDVILQFADMAFRGEDGASGRQTRDAWTDVRYDPARAHSFRHSKTAQPPHTDGAYEADSGNVVFFACHAHAPSGGETYFIGADEIARVAEAEAPALFGQLVTLPVRFGKLNTRQRERPVLSRDADGWSIDWNYFRVVTDGQPEVARLRETFHRFLQERFVVTDACTPVRLLAGECLLFHDQRVLHGRRAFDAELQSERLIWKCNLHWPNRAAGEAHAAA